MSGYGVWGSARGAAVRRAPPRHRGLGGRLGARRPALALRLPSVSRLSRDRVSRSDSRTRRRVADVLLAFVTGIARGDRSRRSPRSWRPSVRPRWTRWARKLGGAAEPPLRSRVRSSRRAPSCLAVDDCDPAAAPSAAPIGMVALVASMLLVLPVASSPALHARSSAHAGGSRAWSRAIAIGELLSARSDRWRSRRSLRSRSSAVRRSRARTATCSRPRSQRPRAERGGGSVVRAGGAVEHARNRPVLAGRRSPTSRRAPHVGGRASTAGASSTWAIGASG